MRDAGMLVICELAETAMNGDMPKYKLVEVGRAYYSEMTLGVTRAYAAMSVNQRIDIVARCWHTDIPERAEYVILEDGKQYRITLKQKRDDHVDLTLVRLEDFYDVYDEKAGTYKSSFIGS